MSGGGSFPPLLPAKRLHPDSASSSSSSGAATEKEVILVSFQITEGPIGHAVYAITVPLEEDRHRHAYLRPHSSEDDKTIYPILEIPSDQCPPTMCCVKLRSRLYYLGGQTSDDTTRLTTYHPDVYFLDIDQALLFMATTASSPPPRPLRLERSLPMKEGKWCCYAFVVEGKIYVLGRSIAPSAFRENNQFEVFDPDSGGDNGEWTTLPRPPFAFPITGHSVIHDKVVITTSSSSEICEDLHYFDLRTREWGDFLPNTTIYPETPAPFVGDCLYFPYKDNIVSLGPSRDGQLSSLFGNASYASQEVSQLLEDLNLKRYLCQLLHLGNNRFLYVMDITLLNPRFPNNQHSSDPEKAALRVVVFEAMGERFTEEKPSDGTSSSDEPFCEPPGSRLLFRAKLLHTFEYIRRSKSGTDAGTSFMSGCFSTSEIDE